MPTGSVMLDSPLSVSVGEVEHHIWCPHNVVAETSVAEIRDFEPLAIVECEYAYVMRCRLCGALGLVEVVAKPGWTARITKMEYDPEAGPLVNFIGECDVR